MDENDSLAGMFNMEQKEIKHMLGLEWFGNFKL